MFMLMLYEGENVDKHGMEEDMEANTKMDMNIKRFDIGNWISVKVFIRCPT